MHRATKLSATVMMGLALAAAPAWVNAADEKKSTTQSREDQRERLLDHLEGQDCALRR